MEKNNTHFKLSKDAAKCVEEYLEYKRIVGDDDNGKTFTPEEYENYKKNILPQRLKNRLFTSWTNEAGMDCKLVGPETPCFCSHRYKQHKTDFQTIPQSRPIFLPCKVKGCKCQSYHHIPIVSGIPIRCVCKHQSSEHSCEHPYRCQNSACKNCVLFKSSYTCMCGQKYNQHKMVVETKSEREARGHPTGHDVPYMAMGGITGFSSLMDGYARLDPSGAGALDVEEKFKLEDHPYVRAYVPDICFSKENERQNINPSKGIARRKF